MRDKHRGAGKAKRRTKRRPDAPRPSAGRPATRDPLAATPDKMLPFVRALAGDTEARLRAVLGDPVTPAALLAAADAAHAGYEQTWRYVQSLHVVPHACRAGCDYCCYLTVETSAPEVFRLAAHLRATRSPAQIDQLQENLRRTAAAIQGLTPEGRVRARVPCALLEDGRCAAHSVRPLACRSWNSRDARACARVLQEGGGDLRPVQDQRPEGINAGVHAGLLAALRRVGLPEEAERQCELNTALWIALEDPQAVERWLGGDDALAPARATVAQHSGGADQTA